MQMGTIKKILKWMLRIDFRRNLSFFNYDALRFWRCAGAYHPDQKEVVETQIILHYHVLEKGLTMPARRLPFGNGVAASLVELILKYEAFGVELSGQVKHAIGVLGEYLKVHEDASLTSTDITLWKAVKSLVTRHQSILPAKQRHFTKDEFYSSNNKAFPEFARSRHTIRAYSAKPLSIDKIKQAVELSMTAPSACNRQQVKVRCFCNKALCHEILDVQGGNRGFGHLSDKVLVVSANLAAEMAGRERNDAYVNGGIFLMNLCYALHYHEVAHCILNWSVEEEKDKWLRDKCAMPENEVVIAILCCGEPEESFNVAMSPRRDVNEIFSVAE